MTMYMKKSDCQVNSTRMPAGLDVSVGIICAIMALRSAEVQEVYLSVTSAAILLIGRNCRYLNGRNSFEDLEVRSSRFLVLVSRSEAICLLACPVSHTYLQYKMAEMDKKRFSIPLSLEGVDIPACSIFVEHRYLQNGGCCRQCSHSIRYHNYLNHFSYNLK